MHTPSGKCDIFFSIQFNNNSNKKKLSNPWIQPNSYGLGWVGLDLCDELGWVEFFLTHLESKNPLNPTHVYPSHIKEKRSKRVKDYT